MECTSINDLLPTLQQLSQDPTDIDRLLPLADTFASLVAGVTLNGAPAPQSTADPRSRRAASGAATTATPGPTGRASPAMSVECPCLAADVSLCRFRLLVLARARLACRGGPARKPSGRRRHVASGQERLGAPPTQPKDAGQGGGPSRRARASCVHERQQCRQQRRPGGCHLGVVAAASGDRLARGGRAGTAGARRDVVGRVPRVRHADARQASRPADAAAHGFVVGTARGADAHDARARGAPLAWLGRLRGHANQAQAAASRVMQ